MAIELKKLNEKELDIVLIGLQLYKVQLKKMMKNSKSLKTAEKEVSRAFLDTETLIGKVNDQIV